MTNSHSRRTRKVWVPKVRYTLAYEDTINKVVKPGMHVLDIGTGTRLLSMMIAKGGNNQVFSNLKLLRWLRLAKSISRCMLWLRKS